MSGVAIFGAGVAATVALVIVGEWIARAAVRRTGYYVWPRHFRRELELDREVNPQLERVVRFDVNADGERGGPCPPGPDVFRMLLAGGSAVESAVIDQPTSWPARVETVLNAPEALRALGATHAHVGNIGRSGMDTRAVCQILERVLPRYADLRLIGVMVGPGDVLRWLELGAPPTPPGPLAVGECFAEHPEGSFGWRPARLALGAVARQARARLLRPVERRRDAARWLGRARAARRNATEFRHERPDARALVLEFERWLRRAVARAQAAAPHVVLLRQPGFRRTTYSPEEEALFWNGGIGNAFRGDALTAFYTTNVLFGLVDEIEACIACVATDMGVPYVDTMPALGMDTATFFDHFHLTPSGSAALADCVAAAVLRTCAAVPRP